MSIKSKANLTEDILPQGNYYVESKGLNKHTTEQESGVYGNVL
jgi:hypothetical protein